MTVQSKTRIEKATQSKPVKRLLALVLLTLPTLTIAETAPKRINLPLPSLKTKPAKSAASSVPPLSYYQIYNIISESYPSEKITPSQNKTVQNHGGSYIDVGILQYGYGNSNVPSIGSYKGSIYKSYNLCGTFATLHYCNAGEVVTGYLDYFRFKGVQSGNFYGSAYSIVSPFRVLSDTIYIK